MKYLLDQKNYCTGTVYEVNKLSPRSYFIPYPSKEAADAVSLSERRYSSALVECLNGDWDFKFYPIPKDVPNELDTEKVEWEKLAVPSCWQYKGYDRPFYVNTRYQFPYDPPRIPTTDEVGEVFSVMGEKGLFQKTKPENEYNFVGVYRKYITVADMEKEYVISFLGVASCIDLYINGKFVGYSEGSHNTAEFDITPYLNAGENELVAVVHRWCNGTYLECQDMFRNNGIFRDVLLFKRNKNDIWDLDVKTEKLSKHGEKPVYKLTACAVFPNEGEVRITLSGHGIEKTVTVSAKDKKAEAVFDSLEVIEWNAEAPNLYDLYFETEAECIKCRVGFKQVKIEGRRFLWNGKAIKYKGVNHHDTSAIGGYTMTPQEIERDILVCKEYNINTIRTSHYPPDPYLLELCDEMGIYVVDEADIETHGVFMHKFPPSYNRISHNPFWEKHYVDRGIRMYQRDKMHPCIMMWSLGNESGGYKNTDAMYREIKKYSDIPIHYESVVHCKRKAYDVGSEMYATVDNVQLVGLGTSKTKEFNDRPYFLCEYVHAMGVGPGSMEDYWDVIFAHEALMGGCIWEMNDHAVLHEDGRYTYGGDHGEWEHDGNFCVDGIFYPDRTPSTGAKIAKFSYRPLRVSHEGGNKFNIFNTTGFTNGEEYILSFVWSDGRTAEISPNVAPMEKVSVEIVPTSSDPCCDNGIEKNRMSWVTVTTVEKMTGREAAKEQIVLSPMQALGEEYTKKTDAPANGFEIADGGVCIKAGESKLVASAEHYTTLSRISTDNDKTLVGAKPMEAFYTPKAEVVSKKTEGGKTTVVTKLTCKKSVFTCTDIYESCESGVLVTSMIHCEKGKGNLPRFGKTFRLDETFDKVTYLAKNGESYCDMCQQAQIEKVTCSVKEMTEPNIRPQESGNRMDCQYVVLSDGARKVRITAVDKPFELAVKPYSDQELLTMTHREDEKTSGTYVTVQAFQMGIGTGSCGPATRPEYCFDMKADYSFSYLISWE